jgi:hypothetical protein
MSYKKNIFEMDPKDFIRSSRIDLIPKILYVKNKEEAINAPFFNQLYLEHIKAFNDFKEDDKKNGKDFIVKFDETIESIKKRGYDKKRGLIPLDRKANASHGAHRIASSIYFNNGVYSSGIQSPKDVLYNYTFFRKRNLSEELLEEISFQYSKIKGKDLHFCIFWGSSLNKINESEINKHLKEKDIDIVYSRDVNLTEIGKKNTIIACYYGEKWLGSSQENYSGAINKVIPCFEGNNKIKVYLLETKDREKIFNFKKK